MTKDDYNTKSLRPMTDDALDQLLVDMQAPQTPEDLSVRLLASFDAFQAKQRQKIGLRNVWSYLFLDAGIPRWAPAGALAGLTALGFFAGASTAGWENDAGGEAMSYVLAAVDEAIVDDEEAQLWVRD